MWLGEILIEWTWTKSIYMFVSLQNGNSTDIGRLLLGWSMKKDSYSWLNSRKPKQTLNKAKKETATKMCNSLHLYYWAISSKFAFWFFGERLKYVLGTTLSTYDFYLIEPH